VLKNKKYFYKKH